MSDTTAITPPHDRPPATASIAPSRSTAPRGAILLLMLAYTFSMLDRQILTILVEPIKADLHLADWQIGAVSGLAFALLYSFGGIPLARIADHGHRVRMIAISLTVWSAFTIYCGAARSFVEMLMARIGVGLGEAGCTPAAHSLISDYVPPEKRGSALAFYQLGTPIGALAGLVLGGVVLSTLSWRWAFVIAGVPGILLAGIVLLVLKEPRQTVVAHSQLQERVPFWTAVRTLVRDKAYLYLCAGSALGGFAYFGQSAFLGSLYLRTHGTALGALSANLGIQKPALLGLLLGVMVGISGGIATWIGGWLADRFGKGQLRGYLSIPRYTLFFAAPMFAGAALANDMLLSLAFLAGAIFMHSLTYGAAYASIQTLAQPQMRGMAVALNILVVNAIGFALGPLVVGLISDFLTAVQGPTMGLRYALSVVMVPELLAALACGIAHRFAK
ncbi:MFS transporter [Cupriavidus taiwanensis]|uniref:spinster family MFS transporter n=1 Tax=Cupriavidus taiwanensis TaxID=164546 RepID=UPI000E17E0F0|nr:MFS transporter [Cupriavidus taiwanensis]SOZ29621.1 Major facilitator superfamily MFS_1 [Cupriavidus taiwanensis]SPA34452.1 Major facilitator superfamily MFS_1 [Cupriavidus taiwanensis]